MEIFEKRSIIRFSGSTSENKGDFVVNETPLTIMLNKQELATIVCSPYAQKQPCRRLSAGEGLIKNTPISQIISIVRSRR